MSREKYEKQIEMLKKKIRETTEKENRKVGEIVRKFYDKNFENFDLEKFKEICKKNFSE